MASGPAISPDIRYLKFREHYTTQEHLVGLHDDLLKHAAVNIAGFKMVHNDMQQMTRANLAGFTVMAEGLGQISDQIEDMAWAIEEGFYQLAEAQYEVARITQEGFQSLSRQFHWGLARIAHEMELNRQVYQDMRRGILYPAATQGREYRERAETALENTWWEEAITNLEKALAENEMDFLAHYHLGHVLWFQRGQWDAAMEQFRVAAKYSDTKRTDDNQKYYAALAYIHTSLLWRMHGEAYPHEAAQANLNAYSATKRALELQPELMMARVEHVANCMFLCNAESSITPDLSKRLQEETWGLIWSDAWRDKELLSSYLLNPDLRQYSLIAFWVSEARRRKEERDERERQEAAEQERQHQREQEQRRRALAEQAAEEQERRRIDQERKAAEARRAARANTVAWIGRQVLCLCLSLLAPGVLMGAISWLPGYAHIGAGDGLHLAIILLGAFPTAIALLIWAATIGFKPR